MQKTNLLYLMSVRDNHTNMYFYFHTLSHKKRGKTDILKLSKHDIAMIIQ